MQEKLDALVRTQAMQLFRQQGLHFTMHQEWQDMEKVILFTQEKFLGNSTCVAMRQMVWKQANV